MVEKGANINIIWPSLLDDDILFLIHRGVNKFGKYSEIEQMWRTWLQITRIELNNILIPDLAGIIVSY